MKKILIFAVAAMALVGYTSCNKNKKELEQTKEQNSRLTDSLQVALANSDSLFSLLYDVTSGMEEITQLEQLVSTDISTESPSARQNIADRMAAIQKGLADRRQRIDELEKQLAQQSADNQNQNDANSQKLRAQINMLRAQLEKQTEMVNDLTKKLQEAHVKIGELNNTITDLNTTVDTISKAAAASKREAEISKEQAAASQKTAQQTQEKLDQAVIDLNTVYYVIGNKDELKKHNFISGGGFLRKTKVMAGDYDASYMTKADKRQITFIPIDAKKAKVLTQQPASTYELVKDANGMITLRILNQARFWAAGNILVIQIN